MKVKELRRLIADKKAEARQMLKEDKLKEAEDITAEIRNLERKVKIAEEIEEEEKRDLEEQRNLGNRNSKENINEMRAIVKSVMGAELTQEERATIKTSDNAAVLPKQFVNQLQEIKKGYGSLKELCDVIPVTKNEGSIPVVDYDQNELADVAEGEDIVDGTLVTTDLTYKCSKVGLIQSLSSELVDDAEVEIESIAKTNFTEITVAKENKKIMAIINTNATSVEEPADYTALEDVMAKALPSVKKNLITLCNVEGYAHLKNMKDKQGRNLNLITVGPDGKEYFNGKLIETFDSSLVSATPGKTKIFYSLSMKEAVKFIERKGVTIAKSTEAGFKDDTIKLRILERIDVVKGSTRSIKKIELA
ncbi:phage major capsid protein [Clostridium sp. Sa3CUN1]|uniref:Phage major capsid protein n=1 Tax=Clostridium gallinarum TaxID=2762246 RepID=A0ABR8Q1B8_9CLOT|nr:phage major capsid protein [Clostridium gallinarum]MBD7914217.1 phage major capsid protein [Clostridium gallinarum]